MTSRRRRKITASMRRNRERSDASYNLACWRKTPGALGWLSSAI